jgi:hypothetical protein
LAFHSGREADHSPPSSTEVKEWVELYLHSPSWCGAQLGRAQGHRTCLQPYTARDWGGGWPCSVLKKVV